MSRNFEKNLIIEGYIWLKRNKNKQQNNLQSFGKIKVMKKVNLKHFGYNY